MNKNDLQTLSIYKTIVALFAVLIISLTAISKHLIDLNHDKDVKIKQLEKINHE